MTVPTFSRALPQEFRLMAGLDGPPGSVDSLTEATRSNTTPPTTTKTASTSSAPATRSTHNNTANNTGDGIDIQEGATGNAIERNIALGDSTHDLFDGNTGCDSNTWTGNTFKTANQPCIR